MRVISFCADGIREAAAKGFYDWAVDQDADIICVQDLRAPESGLGAAKYNPDGYFSYFFDAIDGTTNGVAIYCRKLPKAIMTGLGLAVAIPAVMAYNAFTRGNRVLTGRLDAFAFELHSFLTLGHAPGSATHAPAEATARLHTLKPAA